MHSEHFASLARLAYNRPVEPTVSAGQPEQAGPAGAPPGCVAMRVLALEKADGEIFVLSFREGDNESALAQLGIMACDPELPGFTWSDCAVMAWRVRQG